MIPLRLCSDCAIAVYVSVNKSETTFLKQEIASGHRVPTGPRTHLSPGYTCLMLASEKQSIC